MHTLAAQWDDIIARQSEDWSTIDIELELMDASQSEEVALVLSPLNPWHQRDWRSGVFRFRAARVFGYGTAAELCRKRLSTLDLVGVSGTMRVLSRMADVRPVATQGTTG
jgi:hypothetical protein